MTDGVIKDLWYKNAIVYCVHVGSFMDTNGDGVGDFEGLVRKLDYLAGLGITCIWLMPFQKSPQKDHGYDISDYYSVDPTYGSLGDFVEFAHAAKQRGIRVIMDLVVNHTSDQHPWFKQARRNKNSRYRDYYVWSKKKPKDAHQGMVFPGYQKATWTYDKVAGEYYFHRFFEFQPDLNMENPAVQEEVRKIMGFWLELGVSGFRVDALPFVIERKRGGEEAELRYEDLREMREFLQWRRGDAVILAEANILPKDNIKYFGDDGDRVQMVFNFQVNQRLFYAMASGDVRPLIKALEATRERPSNAQWGHFLRNHDELDLGRLTEAQRQKVFEEFAPEEHMRLYDRGIRRRLATMLEGDRRRIELAYSMMFTLPGTPVLRYGDEIGMGDDLTLDQRDAVRTPMQWSSERHGGFSRAKKTEVPVISKGPYGYEKLNAADQRRDVSSLLNWTERIIRMRKECPELGWGDFTILDTTDNGVLAFRVDWRNNSMVLLHNFRDAIVEVSIKVGIPRGERLLNVLAEEHSEADARGRHQIVLEPFGYKWFRVGSMDDELERSEF